MTKKIITQESFTAGEISPSIYGRTKSKEYETGLETATNAVILSQGPIKRRNGTNFVAEVKTSSAAVRLFKYQFSQSISYILEFGNQYIRFFTSSAQVVESDLTITNITQANPGVVTSTSHGLSDGDQVYITEVVGMTEVNKATVPYVVANKTANTFELTDLAGSNVDTSGFTAYSSAGVINRIYEITSPYTTAQLDEIQVAQSGTSLYITHPDVAPRVLIRNSNTDWDLNTITFYPPPTYESGYTGTGVTVTPAATTGTGVNFTVSSGLFLDADVGRQIINDSDGETGRATITSVTSTTVAVCDIVEDFTDTNAIASGDWHLDLSPICDLEFNGSQEGSIINIRSEYNTGTLGSRISISGITNAAPGVVTTSSAHGLTDGQKVVINDVGGMTQLNGNVYTVNQLSSTTFELRDDDYANVDTTNYTAYASGGIIRQVLTGISIGAFRSADVGKFLRANGGVLEIISVNSATDIDALVVKSMNSSDNTGNWSLEVETWNSTRGYPRSVGFYEQRLIYGGTTAQPQTLWFSEVGIFDGFGIGPDDEDSIEIDLVSNQVNQINWLASSRDLVVGTSGGELTVNSGSTSSISPSTIQQQPRTYHGSNIQQIVPVKDEIVFLQGSNRKIRTFRYDFNIDGYTGEDITFIAEHITEGGLEEVAYAQEPNTSLYAVTTNGDLLQATYDRSLSVIGWGKFQTDGYFENVQTIDNGTTDQVWVVVKRTINGSTKRYVELFVDGDGTDDLHPFSDSYLTLSNPLTITGITAANPAVVTSSSHGLSNGDTVIIKDLVDPLSSDLDSSKTNMSSLNNGTYTVANKTTNTFELSGVDTSNYNAYGSGGNAWEKVTSISGLDHLEGKTVQIKVDGATHADKTVSSGALTLDSAAGEVVIGLPFTTTIKTLNHEFDIGLGSMQGQRARWARPLLRVYKSHRPTVNGEFLPARAGNDEMGQKVPLFSGFLEYGALKWDNTSAITITTSDPLPLEIISITGVIDSGVK